MKCPKCGLINPDIAQRCDCGYAFNTGSKKKSDIQNKKDERNKMSANRELPIQIAGTTCEEGDTILSNQQKPYTFRTIVIGILLSLAGLCFLSIPTGDPTNPAPIGIFFSITTWTGAYHAFSRKRYNFVLGISNLAIILPLITLMLGFARIVRFSFFGGVILFCGAGLVFGIVARIITEEKECF